MLNSKAYFQQSSYLTFLYKILLSTSSLKFFLPWFPRHLHLFVSMTSWLFLFWLSLFNAGIPHDSTLSPLYPGWCITSETLLVQWLQLKSICWKFYISYHFALLCIKLLTSLGNPMNTSKQCAKLNSQLFYSLQNLYSLVRNFSLVSH